MINLWKNKKKNGAILFEEWLDKCLGYNLPDNIKGYNFNLYENSEDGVFDVQLIGAPEYDPDDDDWACEEIFSTKENVFYLSAQDWEECQKICVQLVDTYLKTGKYAEILKKSEAVTVGFVDGELEVVFCNV